MRRTRNSANAALTFAGTTKSTMLSAKLPHCRARALTNALHDGQSDTRVPLMTQILTAAAISQDDKRAHLGVPRRATITVSS